MSIFKIHSMAETLRQVIQLSNLKLQTHMENKSGQYQ